MASGGGDASGFGPVEHKPLINRCDGATSPYIQSHSQSLVQWQLFDDAAISQAKKENKLIFLHIGYSACHFCRMTAQESFNNPAVSSFLNENFIPIIVDKDERPDINKIYQSYNESLNSQGGWPLNVCLTPDLIPTFSGMYWPGPGSEHASFKAPNPQMPALPSAFVSSRLGGQEYPIGQMPFNGGDDERLEPFDFLVAIKGAHKNWTQREQAIRDEAKKVMKSLEAVAEEGADGIRGTGAAHQDDTEREFIAGDIPVSKMEELDLDCVTAAFDWACRAFDSQYGGFGLGPKFPVVPKISFLLRIPYYGEPVPSIVGETNAQFARSMALHTLRRIGSSGLRDHIGGGYHRYSVTRDWSLPRFEKMVAENALLLALFVDAWLAQPTQDTKVNEFRAEVVELADYLCSEPILLPAGGFATSEAADSYPRDGDKLRIEGAHYTWTRKEFDAVVGKDEEDPARATTVAAAYFNVLENGNIDKEHDPWDEFLNTNVLQITRTSQDISRKLGVAVEEVSRIVNSAKAKLLAHRKQHRPRPDVDQMVVVAANGLVMTGLARAAGALRGLGADKERADKYIAHAKAAAEFIRSTLWDAENKVLYRIARDGKRGDTHAFAEDYAFLIEGLLELDQASKSEDYLDWATELQHIQIRLFYDEPIRYKHQLPAVPTQQRSFSGGFYATEADTPNVILRLKDGMDTDRPSTNAVSVNNLYRLWVLLGKKPDNPFRLYARETILAFEPALLEHPQLFPGLVSGVVSEHCGPSVSADVSVMPRREAVVWRRSV